MNNEWYTPEYIIESARLVMGSIDLDPASCEEAQRTVKAATYYTVEEDGLSKPWFGNVWLNPPYSNGDCKRFIFTLSHRRRGINQAIVLVNSSTSTQWFHELLSISNAILLFKKRVRFIAPGGIVKTNPEYDNIAFYFGANKEAFNQEFNKYGRVIKL
jgi:ParB family chromosome partitioning protein